MQLDSARASASTYDHVSASSAHLPVISHSLMLSEGLTKLEWSCIVVLWHPDLSSPMILVLKFMAAAGT
jgi:hypothetical protein